MDWNHISDEELLELESRLSFAFFWNEANSNPGPGYGLIADRAPGAKGICSVASVGFGLTGVAIAAKRGWVSHPEAEQRALGTLTTLMNHAEQVNGFFYHFLDMETGRRSRNCEVSIIDTALAAAGALAVGEYFGGEVQELADQLYRRINWSWYRNPDTNQFYLTAP